MTKKDELQAQIDILEFDVLHMDNIISRLRSENELLWELLKLTKAQND